MKGEQPHHITVYVLERNYGLPARLERLKLTMVNHFYNIPRKVKGC